MSTNDITANGMYKMCLHKKKYRSYDKACEYAKKYTEQYGVEQHAYYCLLCGNYHLTTKTNKK